MITPTSILNIVRPPIPSILRLISCRTLWLFKAKFTSITNLYIRIQLFKTSIAMIYYFCTVLIRIKYQPSWSISDFTLIFSWWLKYGSLITVNYPKYPFFPIIKRGIVPISWSEKNATQIQENQHMNLNCGEQKRTIISREYTLSLHTKLQNIQEKSIFLLLLPLWGG